MSWNPEPYIETSWGDRSGNSKDGIYVLVGDVEEWAEFSWEDECCPIVDGAGKVVAYGYENASKFVNNLGGECPWDGLHDDEDADWTEMFGGEQLSYALLYPQDDSEEYECECVVADRKVAEALAGDSAGMVAPVYASVAAFRACQPIAISVEGNCVLSSLPVFFSSDDEEVRNKAKAILERLDKEKVVGEIIDALVHGKSYTVEPKNYVLADIAEMMTQVGENCLELDGSDDYGYVEEWDNEHIKVAWHNYCEMKEMAGILYPGDPWGPGRYGVSSAGQDGVVGPERLADVKYAILPDDGTDVDMIPADAVKGLADTLEHAEAVIKWVAEHGQQMRCVEMR